MAKMMTLDARNARRGGLAAWGLVFGLTVSAGAYLVGPAVSLDKMTEIADLVVQARAVATETIQDPWFKPCQGFTASSTRLEALSVLKGGTNGGVIHFRHYAADARGPSFFMPQHYEFTPGGVYIVFAKETETPGIVRQLWANHTDKEDQGVLRVAATPVPPNTSVKTACWSGLTGLLASHRAEDVTYAIQQLDEMSRGGGGDRVAHPQLSDFARADVAEAIRPLLASSNREIVLAAIAAAGSHNPYIGNETLYWLVTIGKGHLPGIGTRDARFDNVSGRLLWRELAQVVDGPAPAEVRAAAVRALGRSGVPALRPRLRRWCGDPEALVRQAAVVLLADSPDQDLPKFIRQAAADPAAEVREGAAQAVGLAQATSQVELLDTLLGDASPKVQQAAAMSLLSFDVAASGKVLHKHLRDPEYHSLFVNALASQDPGPHLADLQAIILRNQEPSRFWGGRIPAADSWDILFKYVQSRPAEELRSGLLDPALNALDRLKWYSSSEPRDLYALYLQRGLTNRAQAFRQECRRTVTYEIDYFFNMVDRSPNTYRRE